MTLGRGVHIKAYQLDGRFQLIEDESFLFKLTYSMVMNLAILRSCIRIEGSHTIFRSLTFARFRWEVLKTEGEALGLQQFSMDHTNDDK